MFIIKSGLILTFLCSLSMESWPLDQWRVFKGTHIWYVLLIFYMNLCWVDYKRIYWAYPAKIYKNCFKRLKNWNSMFESNWTFKYLQAVGRLGGQHMIDECKELKTKESTVPLNIPGKDKHSSINGCFHVVEWHESFHLDPFRVIEY